MTKSTGKNKPTKKKPTVKLEPSRDFSVPYDLTPDEPLTYLDEVQIAANTAETLTELGAPLEFEGDEGKLKALLKTAIEKKGRAGREALKDQNVAFSAAAFLKRYGEEVSFDVVQARTAITTKLMEIANCGEIRYELKALELLGKHSDIGLFTDRSEITIRHSDPQSLEEAIKARIKRVLNAQIIDQNPPLDVEDELDLAAFTAKSAKVLEAATTERETRLREHAEKKKKKKQQAASESSDEYEETIKPGTEDGEPYDEDVSDIEF